VLRDRSNKKVSEQEPALLEHFEFRPLSSADLPAVLSILFSWKGEAHLGLESWSEESLRRELSRKGSFGLFSLNGQMRAFLMVRKNSPEDWEVMLLAVKKNWARRGLMRRLLQEFQVSVGLGTGLFLEVHADNQRAIQFYNSLGFEVLSRRCAYYVDGADALVYRFQRH
jgi:ribosomal protein S18 acetylase RimI-like enzyme